MVQPGHLEKKQADTFRICLGGISDYCPESPKKSGGEFLQNGGLTECQLNAAGGRTDIITDIIVVPKCPCFTSP